MPRMKKQTQMWLGGLGLLGLGALALWWAADHRRGTAWAVAILRERFPDVMPMDVETLKHRLATGAAPVLLDCRSEEEYVLSHLAGARFFPVAKVSAADLQALDPQAEYVVYCAAGYRACQMARRMQQAGIPHVRHLEGGIFAWANEGGTTVREGQEVKAVHPFHVLFSRLLRPERRPR